MRLGGYFNAQKIEDLDTVCTSLDAHGLSAIQAPRNLTEMTDEACIAFGEKARELDIVIGEAGMWDNLMIPDKEISLKRIRHVRLMLQKADLMKCHTVVTLVGSREHSDPPIAPHRENYTDGFRHEFREIVLQILDGLDLRNTCYTIEPWHHSFFYQPEEIRAFLDFVDHPAFGVHLDQMNMISQGTYFDSTTLINTTFDLLAKDIRSVHLKDIKIDNMHMFLKLDEVLIGDGVLDYPTLLARLSGLHADVPCYCEHLADEAAYIENFKRLHLLAQKSGYAFHRRQVS